MNPRRLLLAAGLAALALGAAACGNGDSGPRPNVVVVLLDTLRPDHLDLYGYPEETAPWIAEVGRRGAVFEGAYSSSAWTPPATASVFTGLYPTGHGIVHGFETHTFIKKQLEKDLQVEIEVATLPEDHATLPERFAQAGYRAFGVATNPHITKHFGFGRGFERFQSDRTQTATAVVNWLISRKESIDDGTSPYFLYLHLNDIHKPYKQRAPWYQPPPAGVEGPERERLENIAQYNSGIAYVDSELRRLAEAFQWGEETLICLISDHGEAFMEHGFNGHGSSLHTELNRVLMVFAGAGVAPGRVTANASLVDVAPTVLESAGIPASKMDGVSLRRLLNAEDRDEETERLRNRLLFAHRRGMSTDAVDSAVNPTNLWSVLHDDWRLILDEVSGLKGLYNLAEDPFEQDNRFETEPGQAGELSAVLDKFISRGIRKAGTKSRVSMDQALLDDLEAMGYAGGDGD